MKFSPNIQGNIKRRQDDQREQNEDAGVSAYMKRYMKPAVLLLGLMIVLLIAPTSHASNPVAKTLEGAFISASTVNGVEQKGNGPLVFSLDGKAIFVPGEISGEISGPATAFKLSDGTFRIHVRGIFVGTIDGRTGTARFVITVHGVDPDPIGICCYSGPLMLYGGTGGLTGLTASGVWSNDLVDGNRYSLDVIFR